MKALIMCALLVVPCGTAGAQVIYKCHNDNGRVEYSSTGCWHGDEVKRLTSEGKERPEDMAKARKREQADLAQQKIEAAARQQAQAEERAAREAAAVNQAMADEHERQVAKAAQAEVARADAARAVALQNAAGKPRQIAVKGPPANAR
jgi:hypothetical protein